MTRTVIEIESLVVQGEPGDAARLADDLQQALAQRLTKAARDGAPIGGDEQIADIGKHTASAIARAWQGRNGR